MFCKKCGTKINFETRFCPNCGEAMWLDNTKNPVNLSSTPKPLNTMCVIGFVTSIISLFLNFWGIIGIIATILSVVGLVNYSEKENRGKGLAIAGIIIGISSILFAFITIILFTL